MGRRCKYNPGDKVGPLTILEKVKIIHYSGPIKPDCPRFKKWRHMGRYKEMFYECFQKYQGV